MSDQRLPRIPKAGGAHYTGDQIARRKELLRALRAAAPGDFNPVDWMLIAHRITSLATFAKAAPGLPADESADACTSEKSE